MHVDVCGKAMAIARRLNEPDMNALCDLETLCFSTSWSLGQYAQACRESWFLAYGAFAEKTLVSFITLSLAGGEREIINIATHPAWRRQGLAFGLLRHALDDIAARHGKGDVFLDVSEKNHSARALYEKAGFSVVGVRKKYYGGVHDAILMCLRSSPMQGCQP